MAPALKFRASYRAPSQELINAGDILLLGVYRVRFVDIFD